MTTISFPSKVQRIGDRILARLPADASAELPSRGQVAVKATLHDHPFDTVLEPDGRRGHWVALDGELLQSLTVAVDDMVKLEVEPRKAWPEPELPKDLGSALDEASDIAGEWDDITPMARWEWVRWVNATKNPETRQRRVEVTISKLRAGKRRPCCFDLSSCTDPEVSKSGKLIEPIEGVGSNRG